MHLQRNPAARGFALLAFLRAWMSVGLVWLSLAATAWAQRRQQQVVEEEPEKGYVPSYMIIVFLVGFALLIASALHGIATGNLLPASVQVVCVDINPATVTKLSDRGTFQTIGLVTDVEPFLRSLAGELSGEA